MLSTTLTFALLALAPAQTIGESIDDARITARIETMFLMNDHLSPSNINTTTSGGVVTISGSVSDEVQKELAGELAASVDGVKSVNNQLIIVEAHPPASPRRTWRQRVDDLDTAASVKRRLLTHGEFKGLKIGVNVERGVATLYGVVGTEAQRERIGAIALQTAGVARVNNNLTVRAKEPLDQVQNIGRQISDEWTEKRVETALLMNSHIRVRNLNVEVDDGVCILTGLVDTPAQRDLALSVAEHIYGVGKVRNDISVRDAASLQPAPVEVAPADPAPIEFLESEPLE